MSDPFSPDGKLFWVLFFTLLAITVGCWVAAGFLEGWW